MRIPYKGDGPRRKNYITLCRYELLFLTMAIPFQIESYSHTSILDLQTKLINIYVYCSTEEVLNVTQQQWVTNIAV